jgi:hypothetical protein
MPQPCCQTGQRFERRPISCDVATEFPLTGLFLFGWSCLVCKAFNLYSGPKFISSRSSAINDKIVISPVTNNILITIIGMFFGNQITKR